MAALVGLAGVAWAGGAPGPPPSPLHLIPERVPGLALGPSVAVPGPIDWPGTERGWAMGLDCWSIGAVKDGASTFFHADAPEFLVEVARTAVIDGGSGSHFGFDDMGRAIPGLLAPVVLADHTCAWVHGAEDCDGDGPLAVTPAQVHGLPGVRVRGRFSSHAMLWQGLDPLSPAAKAAGVTLIEFSSVFFGEPRGALYTGVTPGQEIERDVAALAWYDARRHTTWVTSVSVPSQVATPAGVIDRSAFLDTLDLGVVEAAWVFE